MNIFYNSVLTHLYVVFETPLYIALLVVPLAITSCVHHSLLVSTIYQFKRKLETTPSFMALYCLPFEYSLKYFCKYTENHTSFIVSASRAKHN